MQTYKIPNRKKKLLTKEFLQTFKNELDKVFHEDDNEADLSKRNYINAYQHIESTSGFEKALQIACEKHNLTKAIYDYQNKLQWYDSDLFDGELMDIMLEKSIIEEGSPSESWYDYTEREIDWTNNGDIQWYKSIIQYKGYNIMEYDYIWIDEETIPSIDINDGRFDNEIRIPIEGLPPHLKEIVE
jgi:AAA15 family ATPase/GTPase